MARLHSIWFPAFSFESVAKIPPAPLAYARAMNAARKRKEQPDPIRRVFRIGLDDLNVTVHRGDDVEAVREVPSSNPPRYYIDDVEVDHETFYRELEREA